MRTNQAINLQIASATWQQLNEAKYHLFDEVRRKFYDIKIGAVKATTAYVRVSIASRHFDCIVLTNI